MLDWVMSLISFALVTITISLIAFIENKRTSNNSILFFIFEAIIVFVFGYILTIFLQDTQSKDWITIIITVAPTILFIIVFYVVNSVKNFKIIQKQITHNEEIARQIEETKKELITFSIHTPK